MDDYIQAMTCAASTGEELMANSIQRISPGMTEGDIVRLILQEEQKLAIKKNWHRPIVRIGENTRLTFDDTALVEPVLSSDDLLFIDLGPVVDGFEADIARTVVFGSCEEYHLLERSSLEIWQQVYEQWLRHSLSGTDLYVLASQLATERGLVLDMVEGGHRVGKFPHTRDEPLRLADNRESIERAQWILEIKLLAPSRQMGAFYEKILM